jgi:hypothetical protein
MVLLSKTFLGILPRLVWNRAAVAIISVNARSGGYANNNAQESAFKPGSCLWKLLREFRWEERKRQALQRYLIFRNPLVRGLPPYSLRPFVGARIFDRMVLLVDVDLYKSHIENGVM